MHSCLSVDYEVFLCRLKLIFHLQKIFLKKWIGRLYEQSEISRPLQRFRNQVSVSCDTALMCKFFTIWNFICEKKRLKIQAQINIIRSLLHSINCHIKQHFFAKWNRQTKLRIQEQRFFLSRLVCEFDEVFGMSVIQKFRIAAENYRREKIFLERLKNRRQKFAKEKHSSLNQQARGKKLVLHPLLEASRKVTKDLMSRI